MSDFQDYITGGWQLCAIDRGKKAPVYNDWNTKPIPADAADGLDGAGLLHVLSGTCSLDLDNLDAARTWLAERGVDVDGLLSASDAVRIDSGRHGRAKLLYRMKRPLRTFKPKGSGLELRCATAQGDSVQDVLPPSIHPDTKKPYCWLYPEPMIGHWSNLPSIPAGLLAVWRSLTAEDSEVESLPPTAPRPSIDLSKLKRAAFKHDPNCEYDEWLKVGMQLNDGTGGAQEGFEIWCQWSKGIKRKPYPGDALLKTHWLSFSSGPGKHVASGQALVAELPADADEFPIESAEAVGETTEDELKAAVRAKHQASIEILEKRLVFVRGAERYFDTEHHTIIGSDNAIEHLFTSMMPRVKTGRLNPVKVLKGSTSKRIVDSLAFHPGEDAIFDDKLGQYANLYRNQLPTPIEPTALELEKINWVFDRIDDSVFRDYYTKFLAHVVQKPGVKIRSAPLIWSETQGSGKTTLIKTIPALLVGNHYSQDVTSSLLNSDFNDYLIGAWHVNLKEFRAGTRGEREAISKKVEDWISDDTLSMAPKGLRGYTAPNHLFVTGSSNKEDAAAIDNNDRKWAIHELHAPTMTPKEVKWIYHDFLLTPRAAPVLRHYFLGVSIVGFSPDARAPETAARKEMIESSISPDYELLQTALEQNIGPLNHEVVLVNEVADYARKHSISKPTDKRIGRMLCRAPFNGRQTQFHIGASIYRAITLKNHERWATATGKEIIEQISGNSVDLSS